MKISVPGTYGYDKKPAILPLKEDEDEKVPKENLKTFELKVSPTEADSAKYKTSIRIIHGTEPVREIIKWTYEIEKIYKNVPINTPKGRYLLTTELLRGSAKTQFQIEAETAAQLVQNQAADAAAAAARAANNTNGQIEAAKAAVLAEHVHEHVTEGTVYAGIQGILKDVCPPHTLAKVKRNLRRDFRKPADMKIRDYYNRIVAINTLEIPRLPPLFNEGQMLKEDEIREILMHAIPKTWCREMDRQGKDPDTMRAKDIMTFLEQLEEAEEFDPIQKKGNNNNNKKTKGKDGKSSNGKATKYCMLHGNNTTHATEECHKMKDSAKRLKTTGDSGKGSSSKNKTWKRESKDSTNKSKKELNAMTKKLSKLKKEVNSLSKKRKSDDSSDTSSDGEMFNIEKELFEMNMQGFDPANTKDDKDLEINEISV